MNLRQLTYFIAVAEEANIGRAATRLNISQPPLTRQIRQLEESLGVELVTRTPKGVELTNAGSYFLKEAQNIVNLVNQVEERTIKASQGKLGRLDVAIFGSAIFGFIPRAVLAFRSEYPDVNIALHTMSKQEQMISLRRHLIDIGFNRLLAPQADLVTEKVAEERLLVAVNAKHEFATRKTVPFVDLADHPLILFPTNARPGFIDKVYRLCHAAGFSPLVSQEVGDAVTGVSLVAAGFGLCLLPESATVLSFPGVVFKELQDAPADANVDLSCIYRANDRSPILERFMDVVRSTDTGSA